MDDATVPGERRTKAVSAKTAQDLHDFNNEIAGRETGRMNRFVAEEQTPKGQRARKEEEDDRLFWTGAMLLQARLQHFNERLDELDRASLDALHGAERRVLETQEHLDRIRQAATRDGQGRLVYRTADGRTGFYDDEQQIAGNDFERIDWKAGAPTWEERRQAGDQWRAAVAEQDAIRAYRERLAEVKDRLGNGSPPAEDELAALEAGIENMPGAVRRALTSDAPTQTSAARQYVPGDLAAAPAALDMFNLVSAPPPAGVEPATVSTTTPAPLRR